jgi:hypothetical protein
MTVMHRIITDRLTQKVTFAGRERGTTIFMLNDLIASSGRAVKRTLTITTVETWIITIGWSEAELLREADRAEQDIIDQIVDPISQDNQEEQP